MVDLRTSAEDLSAAVRIHADRVHDLVRRLGGSPDAAVEVVETSALDLVRACQDSPASVSDLVGWWFARARALGVQVAGATHDLPLGGGVLAADADQARVAQALDALPEVERVAVLVRDSYDLPLASLAVAAAASPDAAMELVGRGRLRFLREIGDDLPTTAGHTVDLGGLARLGSGGAVAARDATTRRHAQSCQICGGVLACQQRAHQLLAGLSVVALPEGARNDLLARLDTTARAALPSSATLLASADEAEEYDETPSRWAAPLYGVLALFVAVGVGLLIGVLLIRNPGSVRTTGGGVALDPGVLPSVTASPLPSPRPVGPPPSASPEPLTSVFTVTPSASAASTAATAGSTAAPSPEPASDPLTLTADPPSGPNGQEITVSGTGWTPSGVVTLEYLDPLGRPTGSRTSQVIDARGRFTTTIAAQDPTNIPGRHTIRAADGANSASVTYDAN